MERDRFTRMQHGSASPLCTLPPERGSIDLSSGSAAAAVPSSPSSSFPFAPTAIIVTDANGEYRTYQPPQATQSFLTHPLPPSTHTFSSPLVLSAPLDSSASSPREELLERRAPFDADQFLEDWLEQQRIKEEETNEVDQAVEFDHPSMDVTPSNPELEFSGAVVVVDAAEEVFDDEEAKPVAMTFRSLAVPAMEASNAFHSPAKPLNNNSQSASVTPTPTLSPRTTVRQEMDDMMKHAPPPEEAISLLNRLPDAEYRQVVDSWIRSLVQQQQGFPSSSLSSATYNLPLPPSPLQPVTFNSPVRQTGANTTLNSPISLPPQSPQSIQSTLLQSYLSFRPWAYSPPLILERVFAYLPVRDLSCHVKSVCTRWKTALETSESIGDPRRSPFVWNASQMLTLQMEKFQSQDELIPAFTSLPLLRALRFTSNSFVGIQQLSPNSPHSSASSNSPSDSDSTASWSWKSALLNVVTHLPLLTRLEWEQVHGLRSDDFKSLLPAHSILSPLPSPTSPATQSLTPLPKAFGLRTLSLKRCIAVDASCLELLSQLPSLEELVLESTSPLTPSKSTGLHYFSSACASRSVLRSPSVASPYAPPPDVCFPSLVHLSLSPLSSDACLTHLIRCTQLRSLSLTGALSDLGIESLCVLSNLTSLSIQCMYDLHSTSSSSPASSYRQSLSASELEGLCDGHGVAALEAIENLTELSVLIPALNFQGIEAICSLQNLKALKIATHFPSDPKASGANSPSSASAAQQQMISPLASNLSFLSVLYVLIDLASIDLSGCPWLTDEHLSWLCDPLLCDRLQSLRLTNLKRISDISAYWISKLIKLQHLDILGTSLTLRGAKEIRSKLAGCVVLHHVDPATTPQAAVRKKRLSTSKKSNLDVVEEGAEIISPRVEEHSKPAVEMLNESTQTDEVDSNKAEVETESKSSSEISVQADINPIAKQVTSFQTQTEEEMSTPTLSMSSMSVHTIVGEDSVSMSHSSVQTDDFVAIAYEQLLSASQLKAEKMLQQAELLKAQKGLAELTAELRQQGTQPLTPNRFMNSKKISAVPSPSHSSSINTPALTLADLSPSEELNSSTSGAQSLQASPSSAAMHKKKVRNSNKKKPKQPKELKRSASNTDSQLSDGGESERRRSNRRTPFLLANLTSISVGTETSTRIIPGKNLSVPRLSVNGNHSLEPHSDSPTSASSTPARSSFLIPVAPLHLASIVSTTSNSPSHTPSAGSSPVLSRKGFLPPQLIPSPPAVPFSAHQQRVSSKMTPLSSPLASNNADFALAFAQSQSPPLIARSAASPVVSAHSNGEHAFKDMKIALLGPSALLAVENVEPNGEFSLPPKHVRMMKRSLLQDDQEDAVQPVTESNVNAVEESLASHDKEAVVQPERDEPKVKRGSHSPFFSSTFTPRSLLSVTESVPIAANASIPPQLSLPSAATQTNESTAVLLPHTIPTIDVDASAAETDELMDLILTSPIRVSSVSVEKQTASRQSSDAVVTTASESILNGNATDSSLDTVQTSNESKSKSPVSAVAYGGTTASSDAVPLHRSRRKKSISKYEAAKKLPSI